MLEKLQYYELVKIILALPPTRIVNIVVVIAFHDETVVMKVKVDV